LQQLFVKIYTKTKAHSSSSSNYAIWRSQINTTKIKFA